MNSQQIEPLSVQNTLLPSFSTLNDTFDNKGVILHSNFVNSDSVVECDSDLTTLNNGFDSKGFFFFV